LGRQKSITFLSDQGGDRGYNFLKTKAEQAKGHKTRKMKITTDSKTLPG